MHAFYGINPSHSSMSRRFKLAPHVAGCALATAIAAMPLSGAFAQDGASSIVDEIMVTAQRRAERIEDVPISVAAFDQGRLDRLNILSTDNLDFATPGIVNTATAGDGISAVFIRGVGTGYSGPGLEGSVAVYLDEVYLQTQTGSAQSTLDVEQIQVLKGPQGTLYGRNATGGALIITTKDPVLDEFGGYVEAGYGKLDWKRTEGVLNLPVSDTFALRFAGFYEERDGYVRNSAIADYKKSGVGAGKTYAFRVKALAQPNDDFRAVAQVSYDRRNGNGAVHSLRFNPDGTPTGLGFYETTQSPNLDGGGGDDTDSIMGSLKVDYSFGDWTLTNTLAYRETRAFGCTDNDGLPAVILTFCTISQRSTNPGTSDGKKDKTLTNEMKLISDFDGPFNVTAGAFYERNKARFPGRVLGSAFGGAVLDFDNYDDLTAYSAYVDGSYQITDALKVSGGLRYTHEKKSHEVIQLYADPTGGTTTGVDSTTFENVSPRMVVSYDMGPTNYYASFSRGFKSGGYNSPSFAIDPILDPEKISAFEVGAKYRSDDGRVSLSTAAYYYDWSGIQVAFITGGGAGIQQQNAAGAENYGFEVNGDFAPDDHWRLSGGFAYTNAEYTSFPNAAVYNLNDAGVLQATAEDLKGFAVQHSPEITANAAITYLFDLPGGWTGDVTAAGRYASKYDFTAGAGGELRAARQDGMAIFNLTGTFLTPNENVEIGWFVNNLTDEKQIQLISTGDTGVYMTPGEPRTFGATVRMNF